MLFETSMSCINKKTTIIAYKLNTSFAFKELVYM